MFLKTTVQSMAQGSGGSWGKGYSEMEAAGELGLGLTQRSKYVFVLSIIPSHLQLEDVEWEDWE